MLPQGYLIWQKFDSASFIHAFPNQRGLLLFVDVRIIVMGALDMNP